MSSDTITALEDPDEGGAEKKASGFAVPWRLLPFDLIGVIAASILGLLSIVALEDGNIIRQFFGAMFILFLPGYSTVSALWPEKPEKETAENDAGEEGVTKGLCALERVAIAVGLSVGITALVGLGLSFLWEISLRSVAITLFSVTTGLALLAWVMRHLLPLERRFQAFPAPIPKQLPPLSFADKLFAIMIVAALAMSGVAVAFISINVGKVDPYTEFYILDENGTLENLPSAIQVDDMATFQLRVANKEQQTVSYNVVVILRNQAAEPVSTIIDYNITISHGEISSQDITFNVSSTGTFRLDAILIRAGVSGVYLNTNMWLDVSA